MAYQDLALPLDIPWKRFGASADMMDTSLGDFKFPPKWRSSIAIFYHEIDGTDLPEAYSESYCERKITYLKIVCSIPATNLGRKK